MHLFSIFMPQIAAKLEKLGFKIIKTEPNKKDPKYLVYKFEDTPAFRQALDNLFRKE